MYVNVFVKNSLKLLFNKGKKQKCYGCERLSFFFKEISQTMVLSVSHEFEQQHSSISQVILEQDSRLANVALNKELTYSVSCNLLKFQCV